MALTALDGIGPLGLVVAASVLVVCLIGWMLVKRRLSVRQEDSLMEWAAPTDEMLREWAYTADAMAPMEDWDLIIGGIVRPSLLVEFASDVDCPNQDFFLQCLYGRVGDEIWGPQPLAPATWEAVEEGMASDQLSVRLWARRSTKLRQNPNLFDYEDWFGGALARSTGPWPS